MHTFTQMQPFVSASWWRKTHKQQARTSQEHIKAFIAIFVWEEWELNRKAAVGSPGAGELSFYFINYRIDDLSGERLNSVMVKVTGGMFITVFQEKIQLRQMVWRSSSIPNKAVELQMGSEGKTEGVLNSMWTSLIWAIWKSSNAQ